MTNDVASRPHPSIVLECPWCGRPVESDAEAAMLRCPGCSIEVSFAPDERRDGRSLEGRLTARERAAA